MAYSKKVIDHYESPRNVGRLDAADPNVDTSIVSAPACDDMMRLRVRVNEQGVTEDVKFKAYGCSSTIASSSLATEWMKGETLGETETVKNTTIAEELALLPMKIRRSALVGDAIKAAVRGYKQKRGLL